MTDSQVTGPRFLPTLHQQLKSLDAAKVDPTVDSESLKSL
jgi:hypothetical protein